MIVLTEIPLPSVIGWEWWDAGGTEYHLVWVRGGTYLMYSVRPKNGKWHSHGPISNPSYAVPAGANTADVRRIVNRFVNGL